MADDKKKRKSNIIGSTAGAVGGLARGVGALGSAGLATVGAIGRFGTRGRHGHTGAGEFAGVHGRRNMQTVERNIHDMELKIREMNTRDHFNELKKAFDDKQRMQRRAKGERLMRILGINNGSNSSTPKRKRSPARRGPANGVTINIINGRCAPQNAAQRTKKKRRTTPRKKQKGVLQRVLFG